MTSPTAIPSPLRLDSITPGVRVAQRVRERHALDVAGAVLDALGPDEAALFLQYAHPWVQTGETA